ncbi:MAG: hypothetical protein PVG03_16520 [Desulfarculaceae bacterium]
MTYKDSPHGLVELRQAFRKMGLREAERQLNYAINREERLRSEHTLWPYIQYVFFELTCGWGLYPGRPLLIMLGLIPFFAIPYLASMYTPGKDGIFRYWDQERIHTSLGSPEPQPLKYEYGNVELYALYFSFLSAFRIGWREVNVGNWIARMQPREYTLRATGWVRTVSGVQSLISVYLLALSVLTYFGRPFD